MSVVSSLRMADVNALRLAATGLETLRALAGPQARPMGHDRPAEYAFLAVDAKPAYPGLQEVTRSFVFLPNQHALVEFDIAISADPPVPVAWKLEGAGSVVTLLSNETQFLHLVQTAGQQAPGKIESEDLAGLRLGGLAI